MVMQTEVRANIWYGSLTNKRTRDLQNMEKLS